MFHLLSTGPRFPAMVLGWLPTTLRLAPRRSPLPSTLLSTCPLLSPNSQRPETPLAFLLDAEASSTRRGRWGSCGARPRPARCSSGFLTLASALIPLGIAWAGKHIIDAVVRRSAEAHAPLGAGRARARGRAALWRRRASRLARTILGARLGIDINVAILEKALTLELRHFEDSEFYDRLTRARREASCGRSRW